MVDTKTLLYVFGVQGVIAGLLDGVFNALIGNLIFRSQATPIPSFTQQISTGYGPDLIFATFLQGTLTWLLAGSFIERDSRVGFGPTKIALQKFRRPWLFKVEFFRDFFIPADLLYARPFREWVGRFLINFVRALVFGFFNLLLFGVPTIIIMHKNECAFSLESLLLFKALFFGFHGMLITPFVSFVALVDRDERNSSRLDDDVNEESLALTHSEEQFL
eukprot:TRINITY_DN6910_c0_g1_i1.p1 TRINITY_DN6910_c0_g1~~TRINITY_DN6910_c0_g1_i1.p1  ORF type:complete len:219 (-),score=37.44 TRINITY_DN6910_c0_g1_i1:167-823(-)